MTSATEHALNGSSLGSRVAIQDFIPDELVRLKHELLRAEIRLAKARASAAGAEADVKVLSARLRAFTK